MASVFELPADKIYANSVGPLALQSVGPPVFVLDRVFREAEGESLS